jgi:CHAT domain-containing protein
MSKLWWLLLVLTGASLAAAEEPPYKRLLHGDDAKKAEALQKQIDQLSEAAKFAEALSPAEELQGLRQRGQGTGHWEAADAARRVQMLRLAARLPAAQQQALAAALPIEAKSQALEAQGRFAQAEPLWRKALAVFEEILGPKDPFTARTYINLAFNLGLQGRAQEAEPLFRSALAICEEVLGLANPDTAISYSGLAANLDGQGRFKEAEPLHRKALAIFDEVLGPRHTHTAFGCGYLGLNLREQGRAEEAEPLFRKALAICEQVLGHKHPYTAAAFNNLAFNLDAQGRATEAEPLLRQALAVRQELLDPKHPDIAESCNNLAGNLDGQGRTQEAEPLYRKAQAIWEEALGPKHPRTASSCSNLAANLLAQRRYQEAEPLHRKALAIRQEALGEKHSDTARSYNSLAANLQAQGLAKEAEPLFRKAQTIWESAFGPKHSATASGYHNLASNLQLQGRLGEAEPLWQASADGIEAARLRLATFTLDRAAAVRIQPHLGLAACRARLGRPAEAWSAAEAGLARGLLDDLAAAAALPPSADSEDRDRQRAARLNAVDRLLTSLLTKDKLDEEQGRRRDDLLRERAKLDTEVAGVAAERSRKAVLPLAEIQEALAGDAALVFWVDLPQSSDHWGCVVRHSGLPAWVRLKGSGPADAWTDADDRLPRLLRDDLSHGEPDAARHARRLAAQRIEPLAPHLGATDTLPAARRLVVVPVGVMAGIPVEVLSERHQVSYAPSGSVFARLHQKHRRLQEPMLLALGDPNFQLPDAPAQPQPPDYGLYVSVVLPDSNAGRAGLHSGDVLLRYGDTRLTTKADLKTATEGPSIPIQVWREGKTRNDLRLDPGKLGVALSDDPPAVALRKSRELDLLADARVRGGLQPLPGTRLEVATLTALLPPDRVTLLLGSAASEQRLDALAAAGTLKQFRLLHFATHGTIDPASAAHSALELARDRLLGPEEQAKLAAAGKKVPTGRLSVGDIAKRWQLDADLVTLSACQTALGPQGGGEGLLGFSQVLLGKGARSLLLSLWKVDDTATALLMTRFYLNLLGKRPDLTAPLLKAEALREAKRWLRDLPRAEVEKLAAELARGAVRGSEESAPAAPAAVRPVLPPGDTPYAHPYYWAAFVLIGDPD